MLRDDTPIFFAKDVKELRDDLLFVIDSLRRVLPMPAKLFVRELLLPIELNSLPASLSSPVSYHWANMKTHDVELAIEH